MVGTYNPWLVALSVVVAVVSSFVARDISSRLDAARSSAARLAWHALGATALGSGIWAMHFVGMLAYALPFEVRYDVGLMLLSVLLAAGGAALARSVFLHSPWNLGRFAPGALALGAAIIGTYYTAMAAIHIEPPVHYRPGFVGASMALATAASLLALWSAFGVRAETPISAMGRKAGSALVLGSAIAGSHYIAMAGVVFDPHSRALDAAAGVDRTVLAMMVGGLALIFEISVLLIDSYDAFRASRAEQRVGRLSQRLVELRDAERRRMSQELHDRIGQNLAALHLNLDILERDLDAPARERLGARLRDSQQIVDATVDAVEDLTTQLRPPMLDAHGLPGALREIGTQFARRTGIAVDVEVRNPAARCAPAVELEIVRIVLEALTNVAKHACANRVGILLSTSGDSLSLEIRDNGIGFDPASQSAVGGAAHWGLQIMRERADAIGAALAVHSEPARGTTISLTLAGLKE
ncbi:MAG TPA: MHYT domain-containing protein [Burkholderiaceae bacterium]|nr:MHYT domain-containing protein [Burkholderiaceae bacterium]